MQRHTSSTSAWAALTSQAMRIAEFLHSNTRLPVCAKVHVRRAAAYRALDQLDKAEEDLKAALLIEPDNKDIQQQLSRVSLNYWHVLYATILAETRVTHRNAFGSHPQLKFPATHERHAIFSCLFERDAFLKRRQLFFFSFSICT